MLPELGGGNHPDAIVDGFLVEFKEISGNIGIVGKRFSYAKKQSENVFLNITNSTLLLFDIYRKLRGEIISHNYDTGKIFIYFNNKLYEWNTIDIKNPH